VVRERGHRQAIHTVGQVHVSDFLERIFITAEDDKEEGIAEIVGRVSTCPLVTIQLSLTIATIKYVNI